ncbi:MAG: hypothetical protein V4616_00915 [Bacteroidota bacterium]
MGFQKGVLRLEGTVGGITFYKGAQGFMAREKGGISKDRIKNDPAFARTRENLAEFTSAVKAGKFIRDLLRPLSSGIADGTVSNRLTRIMSAIQKLDAVSDRGQRNVYTALQDPTANALLQGFRFNQNVDIRSVITQPLQLDTTTGEIEYLEPLVPTNDVVAPPGATHVKLQGAVVDMDFSTLTGTTYYSNVQVLPLTSDPVNIALSIGNLPAATVLRMFLIRVDFRQQVNGSDYNLSNGAYNGLQVLAVG